MDWFERITGFREIGYDETRSRLHLAHGRLHSRHGTRSYGVGVLETPSLAELRTRALPLLGRAPDALRVGCVGGDVRAMHAEPGHAGALFQAASQFNLLEMPGPDDTPERGVTAYRSDPTQGPACAIAAGAATIYRNYLAPVDGGFGQTRTRQIDCLRELGAALGNHEDGLLWTMRNGYALCSRVGITVIDEMLGSCGSEALDRFRGLLRIGVHWDVELTETAEPDRLVSQAFCSALPIAYSDAGIPVARWQRFASLVLEAAYEATLLAALLNRDRTGCPMLFLTRVGGGAFGNEASWIHAAMVRALEIARDTELDVQIVSRGTPPEEIRQLASRFKPGRAGP